MILNPDLAATFESFAQDGGQVFSEGDIGQRIVHLGETYGGHVTHEDLSGYEVVRRSPLAVDYGNARLLTNPPPSTGGILISFAIRLLSGVEDRDNASLVRLVEIMASTNQARVESGLNTLSPDSFGHLLDADFTEQYRNTVLGQPKAHRGTTHISVIDRRGNVASVTLSNGEGCGHMVPGAGYMLNNMLGEEDINPQGFHNWKRDSRMSSMMAPSLIDHGDGSTTALGSGGSNRIRTAILQVVRNIVGLSMSLEAAIEAPRLHLENGQLSLEQSPDCPEVDRLISTYPAATIWPEPNMFFGGVHAVSRSAKGDVEAIGDPRRSGAARIT